MSGQTWPPDLTMKRSIGPDPSSNKIDDPGTSTTLGTAAFLILAHRVVRRRSKYSRVHLRRNCLVLALQHDRLP